MFSTLFISIGLAMDAFGASIALGSSTKENIWKYGLFSSLMFGVFQALMPLIGWIVGNAFKQSITGLDHWIAFCLLLVIGLKMIKDSMKSDEEFKNDVNTKIILLLAVATSIDALIIGMGLGIIGASLFKTIFVIGIVTAVLSLIGVFIGMTFGKIFQNKAVVLGGIILIAIGTKVLIEHQFL